MIINKSISNKYNKNNISSMQVKHLYKQKKELNN